MLHQLFNAEGSRKPRKRIGRGPGSTLGKTSGRGHKGQNSRSGSRRVVGFEGGQMPIHRRLPKRGFTNIFRKNFRIITLSDLERAFDALPQDAVVSIADLESAGIIDKSSDMVKLLGNGDITRPIRIRVDKASKAAVEKVAKSGGEVSYVS